jgi:hypothetical protein
MVAAMTTAATKNIQRKYLVTGIIWPRFSKYLLAREV